MHATRTITRPNVHIMDADDAYGRTQYDDTIRDGDVLIVPAAGVVGFLCGAWPVALHGASDDIKRLGFHTIASDADHRDLGGFPASADGVLPAVPGRDYSESVDLATRVYLPLQ